MEKTLEKIYGASLRFLEPMSLENTCEIVVKEAIKLVNAEYGSLFIYKKNQLRRYYTTSEELAKIVPPRTGNVYTTFREQKSRVITIKENEQVHPKIRSLGIRSIILIPLIYKNKSMGVLTMHSFQNKDFSENELNILLLYGSLASIAIKKNQLFNESQKAIELRDMFMSMASHELRTPLTVINGYIQMLHNRFKDQDTTEAQWVKRLYVENSRLINLVKELLEVNRIRAGQIQYFWTEQSITEICELALKQFSLHFPDRSFSFKNEIGENNPILVGDKEKLIQMIVSVLDNAVKFSDIHSHISVELFSKPAHFYIAIIDEGMGIEKEAIDRIFESFYRDEVNKNEGIGIGLYLVKNIVEQHHGTIKILSKIQKGTKVIIKLPRPKSS
jgi:K+-sensing histidine kinase KdpD